MYVIKKSLSSVVVVTTFLLTTSAFAMKREGEDYARSPASQQRFSDLPQDIKVLTIKQTAYQQCLEENAPVTMADTLRNLALVCTEWLTPLKDEMKVGAHSWKAWYGVTPENEHIYNTFLNSVLIFRPKESDEGLIQLKISELINPLEGTFDLSQCGDVGKCLSISTGYRKGMKPENKDKLEIWLSPRFMIEKKIQSSASHYQPIMGDWKEDTAPIGILWNWGDWNDLSFYDYLTSKNAMEISPINLLASWWDLPDSRAKGLLAEKIITIDFGTVLYFMFICEPK